MTCIINQERRQPQETNTLMWDMLFPGSCIINTGSESWMKICEIALMVLEDGGRKGSLCLYIIQGKPWAGCRCIVTSRVCCSWIIPNWTEHFRDFQIFAIYSHGVKQIVCCLWIIPNWSERFRDFQIFAIYSHGVKQKMYKRCSKHLVRLLCRWGFAIIEVGEWVDFKMLSL